MTKELDLILQGNLLFNQLILFFARSKIFLESFEALQQMLVRSVQLFCRYNKTNQQTDKQMYIN